MFIITWSNEELVVLSFLIFYKLLFHTVGSCFYSLYKHTIYYIPSRKKNLNK